VESIADSTLQAIAAAQPLPKNFIKIKLDKILRIQ